MSLLGRIRTAYTGVAVFSLNMLVVFVALNAVAWWFHPGTPAPDQAEPWPGLAANIERYAYPDLPPAEADALARESMQRFQYEAFTEIRERPLDGRFFHIEEAGYRRIKDQGPWPPTADHYNVFVFGGSTTFGYGVMDADTIPSYLQPMLPAVDGRAVRVYNFGRCGYYSSQERALFERLVTTDLRPDAAIFVDGLNDFSMPDDNPVVASRLQAALEDPPSPLARTVDVFPLTTTARHLLRVAGIGGGERWAPGYAPLPEAERYVNVERADRVIERWIRSMRLIEGMGQGLGIATVFVWQPIASYEFPAFDVRRQHKAGANGWAGFAYPRMRERTTSSPLGPRFLWCADVARDGTAGFYVDAVHYAPVLAKRVAECIATEVRDRGLLRAPAR
jgi:hypothetical protein